MVVAFAADEPK